MILCNFPSKMFYFLINLMFYFLKTENCLSMFLVFKKKQKVTEPVDPPQVYNDRDFVNPDQSTVPKYVTGTASIAKGEIYLQYPKTYS